MPSNFFLPIPGTFWRLAGPSKGPCCSLKAIIFSASLGPTPFSAQSSSAVAVLICKGKRTTAFFFRGFFPAFLCKFSFTLSSVSTASGVPRAAYSNLDCKGGVSTLLGRSPMSTKSTEGSPHGRNLTKIPTKKRASAT